MTCSKVLDEDIDNPLKIAMARHDVVAMRVLDPAELALPDLGLVELIDAETGTAQLVDSSSPQVRAAYAKAREAETQRVERRLRQLGCDLVDLRTNADFVAPLIKFFQARSARLRSGR